MTRTVRVSPPARTRTAAGRGSAPAGSVAVSSTVNVWRDSAPSAAFTGLSSGRDRTRSESQSAADEAVGGPAQSAPPWFRTVSVRETGAPGAISPKSTRSTSIDSGRRTRADSSSGNRTCGPPPARSNRIASVFVPA